MDRIQPGVVVWKRVNIAPKNRFKKVENGNYVIEIAKVSMLRPFFFFWYTETAILQMEARPGWSLDARYV